MQTVGYDGWQFPLGGGGGPAGGGGGAGALRHVALVKLTTGCSSMPLGATPVWPWIWSKKPTPEIVAVPPSLVKDRVGEPHAATNAFRARRIFVLAFGDAPAVQDAAGNSAIIVARLLLGSAITRWMSLSSSSFISSKRCPHAERRPLHASQSPQADVAGDLLLAQGPDRRRARRETEPAPGRIGERLHGPALDTAADLLRARSSRLRGSDPRPREGDDRQAEEKSSQITPHCDPHAPLPRAEARPSWTRLVLQGVSPATGGGAIAHSEQLARRFGL